MLQAQPRTTTVYRHFEPTVSVEVRGRGLPTWPSWAGNTISGADSVKRSMWRTECRVGGRERYRVPSVRNRRAGCPARPDPHCRICAGFSWCCSVVVGRLWIWGSGRLRGPLEPAAGSMLCSSFREILVLVSHLRPVRALSTVVGTGRVWQGGTGATERGIYGLHG